jgi:hypothetical protein
MRRNETGQGMEFGHEAEETLRLLAELPPPAELTDRVHQRLAMERNAQGMPERRGFWSLWMPARRLQFAGAAVLMMAVAGSTWSVYHQHSQASAGAPVTPVAAHGSSPDGAGGFGSAKVERKPPTLNPIKVPSVPRKKPSASRVKPGGKAGAAQAGSSQDGLTPESPVAQPKQ